jgi:predicted secreted protein
MKNWPRTLVAIVVAGAILSPFFGSSVSGQPFPNRKTGQEDKFRQLEEILPTPNSYRSAAGEPGPDYWQQQIDYTIDVTLNDADQSIDGNETIRYFNRSPHTLRYLWLQLDPNIFAPDSTSNLTRTGRGPTGGRMSTFELESMMLRKTFDGG